MSEPQEPDVPRDEVADIEPGQDAEAVRGGRTPSPGGPVPTPYPN